MRLIHIDARGNLSLTRDLYENIPPYAILSHTWGSDDDEVTYAEMRAGTGRGKTGFKKIEFCAKQAQKDGLAHCWVDTCCIDKHNAVELQEAITSMFRWYAKSRKCYVYLTDVSTTERSNRSAEPVQEDNRKRKRDSVPHGSNKKTRSSNILSIQPQESREVNIDWKPEFMISRWFTRGWTLQELIAPTVVEFYSADELLLGNRQELLSLLHDATRIPLTVLNGAAISQVSIQERMIWAKSRTTKKPEDKAYCLLGLFDVSMPLIYGEGEEEAHRRLVKVVEEKVGIDQPIHEHWLVSRLPNPAFTGRGALLQQLQISISHSVKNLFKSPLGRIVVWGLGGQGKSELCLQLASRLREIFWALIWIDISTTQIAENGFTDAAQKLGYPVHDWKSALSIIANLKKPWLLILDNADDLDMDYQHYFPESRFGIVIMTTRNKECQQYAINDTVALEGLSSSEAQDLLLKTARISAQIHDGISEDAQKVADLLHSHPLALTQAGAYIAQGRCTLAEYPLKYEAQRSRLLTFRTSQVQSRYQDVYATFEISAEMLAEMKTPASEDALELLRFFALCGSSRFPLFVFEKAWQRAKTIPCDRADDFVDHYYIYLTPWHVRQIPSVCDTNDEQWDSDKLFDAIHLLQSCSLVSLSLYDDHQFVSLHPLVYAWARDRQDAVEKQQSWLSVGCVLALIAGIADTITTRQHIWLHSHFLSIITWDFTELLSSGSKIQLETILLGCGWFLHRMGDDSTILGLTNRMIQGLGINPKAVNLSHHNLYMLHSASLSRCGQSAEALQLTEALVNIARLVPHVSARCRWSSELNLAFAYSQGGKLEEAGHLLGSIMQAISRSVVADDILLTGVRGELACVYIELDRAREAVKIVEEILTSLQRHYRDDDMVIIRYRTILASAYAKEGRLNEAIDVMRDVIHIQERTLPDTHVSLSCSRYWLGRFLFDIGKYEDAVTLQSQVVKAHEVTLDVENERRLCEQHRLARYMWKLDCKEEALDRMAQVFKIREQVLKPEHPERLFSECCLARYMWELGRKEEALDRMAQVVKIQERVLKPEDPDRLAPQYWLAQCMWKLGREEEGLMLMREVVSIQSLSLPPDNPGRLESAECLAYMEDNIDRRHNIEIQH